MTFHHGLQTVPINWAVASSVSPASSSVPCRSVRALWWQQLQRNARRSAGNWSGLCSELCWLRVQTLSGCSWNVHEHEEPPLHTHTHPHPYLHLHPLWKATDDSGWWNLHFNSFDQMKIIIERERAGFDEEGEVRGDLIHNQYKHYHSYMSVYGNEQWNSNCAQWHRNIKLYSKDSYSFVIPTYSF